MVNTLPTDASAELQSDVPRDVRERTGRIKEGSRERAMRVLDSWDRGIDNVSERVGDAMSAGFRVFFRQLLRGKPKRSRPDVYDDHA